jgi:hypothetical protein
MDQKCRKKKLKIKLHNGYCGSGGANSVVLKMSNWIEINDKDQKMFASCAQFEVYTKHFDALM